MGKKSGAKSLANFAVPSDPRISTNTTLGLDKHPKEDATYMSLFAMLFGVLAIVFKVCGCLFIVSADREVVEGNGLSIDPMFDCIVRKHKER